ncbi:MAG: DUF4843 domain-containing protein [Rikenellaceae bacterium]|nr:DUF4843 domain-containing protein [Rikenellaceae bacterium]MCL2693084.1 DUF4843 domain-containing protein [Rikenellaceae bacterium]
MKNNIVIIGALFIALMLGSCKKDDILYFDSEKNSAVSFPGFGTEVRLYPGYNAATQTFFRNYSFLSGPSSATSATIDLPVKVVGNRSAHDRVVGYKIISDKSSATGSDYAILEAVIPAGELFGHIRFELFKTPGLDTEQKELFIELTASEDLARGTNEYIKAQLSWHNMLPMPPIGTFECRTYNFLINNGQSMNLADYSYYSSNAHLAILEALNWPKEPELWPRYNSGVVNGISVLAAIQNGIYYNLIKDYLDNYAAANGGERLKHNGGLAVGQDVIARVWP